MSETIKRCPVCDKALNPIHRAVNDENWGECPEHGCVKAGIKLVNRCPVCWREFKVSYNSGQGYCPKHGWRENVKISS